MALKVEATELDRWPGAHVETRRVGEAEVVDNKPHVGQVSADAVVCLRQMRTSIAHAQSCRVVLAWFSDAALTTVIGRRSDERGRSRRGGSAMADEPSSFGYMRSSDAEGRAKTALPAGSTSMAMSW